VADTYAALTSRRPHRPAVGRGAALATLRAEAAAGRLAAKPVELLHEIVETPGRAAGGADDVQAGGGDAEGLPPLARPSSDGLASSF
jgi:hypothetical protein